jgi:predicted nucleic acid-binding protein
MQVMLDSNILLSALLFPGETMNNVTSAAFLYLTYILHCN